MSNSISMRVQDTAADALNNLVGTVPVSGYYTPTFSSYTGLAGVQLVNANYRVDGAMVTITGIVETQTLAEAAPYVFKMTVPEPYPVSTTQFRINGSVSGFTSLGAVPGEILSGVVVGDDATQVQCTFYSTVPAEATVRDFALVVQFSYFLVPDNQLVTIQNL
jgi:hypothetical protein